MGNIILKPYEFKDIVRGSTVKENMTGAGITIVPENIKLIKNGHFLEMNARLHQILTESETPIVDMATYFESRDRKIRDFSAQWKINASHVFDTLITLEDGNGILSNLVVGACGEQKDWHNLLEFYKKYSDHSSKSDEEISKENQLLIKWLYQIRRTLVSLEEAGIVQENIYRNPTSENDMPSFNVVYSEKTNNADIFSMNGNTVNKTGDLTADRRRLHDMYASFGDMVNAFADCRKIKPLYDTTYYMDSGRALGMIEEFQKNLK